MIMLLAIELLGVTLDSWFSELETEATIATIPKRKSHPHVKAATLSPPRLFREDLEEKVLVVGPGSGLGWE